ncbi:tetraacyldisaccharide 4'-kinase [Pedobacter sp. ASV12]|uniref:tetraacyldisaccharide 4'-kinase n=1 Tax=Pedobacter sp. ASV12 TaxID=2795120 RepID=UPI0018EBA0BC|nr:tetraacyldisaccharide 4'-kinase [Pedobacter sp. ASV12]
MLRYLRLLLFPFALLYGMVVMLRNKLYDWGIFKSVRFDLPVICIGNVVVGGTGKTPTTEYLVRLLADYQVAILSRGYGRKTKGFVLADAHATAETIGDEPLQYHQKFPHVTVAVCEDRVKGINQLKANHEVILLDDAFQHRAVKAGFNILLFDFASFMHWQFLLPMGNLREPFNAYRRADALLITKVPVAISQEVKEEIGKGFLLHDQQTLSFASIKYGELVPLFGGENQSVRATTTVFLLTGIANPVPLANYLKSQTPNLVAFEFPDHYHFSQDDIRQLVKAFGEHSSKEKIIITTEKDSKRLLGDNLKDLLLNLPIFYLPIQIDLAVTDKQTFDQNILDYVARTKRVSNLPQA